MHRKRTLITMGMAAAVVVILLGCPPVILDTWFVNIGFGTEADDCAQAITKTCDGGYAIAGYTETTAEEDDNATLVKLDANGNVAWMAEYGDERNDAAYAVDQTNDGGYILAGRFGGDFDETSDAFLLKTDPKGQELWRKTYDGGTHDLAQTVEQTKDGGFIVGVELDLVGSSNAAMIKTNRMGVEQWRATGDEGSHIARAIQTADGGYLLGWWTISFNAETWTFDGSIVLLKTDANGQEAWRQTYDDNVAVELDDVRVAPDGGYVLAGQYDLTAQDSKVFVWKLDAAGAVTWKKTYGSDGRDAAHVIRPLDDGGYIVAGGRAESLSDEDMYLMKIDNLGELAWERVFGGTDFDVAWDVIEANSGGYVLAGGSQSFEIEGHPDHEDILVVKTDADGHSVGIEAEL